MAEPYNLPEIGQLVRSICGRDYGQYYLVWRIEGRRVLLVDGRKRLTSNAKVKNPRHLQLTRLVSGEFQERVGRGRISPEDIRAAMAVLLKENLNEEALDDV